MPLSLPNLDDRRFVDLVEEGRSLITRYAPSWTNHNPSDPGVTLIELFAWHTESLLYQLNRINERHIVAYLKLLNGPEWTRSPEKSLKEEIRETVRAIRDRHRAVTCRDFEDLALTCDPQVGRAYCVPRSNLESGNPSDSPGHLSLVIVPRSEDGHPEPTSALIHKVKEYLEPRRLLTTRLHVVGPRYVTVGIRLALVLIPGVEAKEVQTEIVQRLQQFFHPIHGGVDGTGWPAGRSVYISEIYEQVTKQSGVDHVTEIIDPQSQKPLDELTVDQKEVRRLRRSHDGKLIAVDLYDGELVHVQVSNEDIAIK